MDSQIITEKTYCDTLDGVIAKMRARTVDLGVRHILFVPDKYTLACEQKLYAGTFGAFDAEVLTLNRLFFRICTASAGEYLSKFGAIMLCRKIIASVKKSLKCFNRCADFKGFAEKMYENIAQMVACNISPEQLLDFDGALGLKLQDISLIYSEYLRLTTGLFVDAGGRMELLLAALGSTKYFDNMVCYFANFDGVTAQTQQVIQAICARSKASFIGEVSVADTAIGAAEVYESGNKIEQVKAVAKRIRNNAFKGISYGEMAVAVPTTYGYAKIMRIFSEFEIPYYVDTKCNLGAHPLGQYFKQVFAAADKIGRTEYIALAKNPYTQILVAEQDIFECYLLKYCIDYLALAEPFTKGHTVGAFKAEDIAENENFAIAERVRAKLFGICALVHKRLQGIKNAVEFSHILKNILPENAMEITKQIADLSGEDIGDATSQILNIAAVLSSVFGDKFTDAADLQAAFIEGLDAIDISLIPARANCVVVSDFTTFRGSRFKALFVLDFNESFPPTSSDCGIITDSEIQILKERKVNLEPKIADVNERSFAEAKSLLSACEELFVAYLADEHPSVLINYLYDNANSFRKNSPDLEYSRLAENNNFELIARHVSSRANAAEMLCLGVCSRLQGENGYGFESELAQSLGESAQKFLPKQRSNPDFLNNAESLFFRKTSTTISRIQEYFSCPYKHFLKYGLVLKQRDDGVLSPLDVGTFLHKVIEIFVSRGRLDTVSEDVKNIIDQIVELEPRFALESFKAVMQSMTDEAIQIACICASQIKAGTYKNLGVEMHFSNTENSLNTLQFTAGSKLIFLSGVIDRVDVLGDWARVIDYKTGNADFNFNELYYGLKIQLLIYMKILIANGYKPAGMFYFPFSAKWSDNIYSHRLNGLFNGENLLFEGMDIGLREVGYKSDVINARTKVKLNSSGKTELDARGCKAYSTTDLYDFLDYAYGVLQGGANEITSGYIAKSPAQKGERAVCEYCEMQPLCGFDSDCGRARKIKTIKADFILDSLKSGVQNG